MLNLEKLALARRADDWFAKELWFFLSDILSEEDLIESKDLFDSEQSELLNANDISMRNAKLEQAEFLRFDLTSEDARSRSAELYFELLFADSISDGGIEILGYEEIRNRLLCLYNYIDFSEESLLSKKMNAFVEQLEAEPSSAHEHDAFFSRCLFLHYHHAINKQSVDLLDQYKEKALNSLNNAPEEIVKALVMHLKSNTLRSDDIRLAMVLSKKILNQVESEQDQLMFAEAFLRIRDYDSVVSFLEERGLSDNKEKSAYLLAPAYSNLAVEHEEKSFDKAAGYYKEAVEYYNYLLKEKPELIQGDFLAVLQWSCRTTVKQGIVAFHEEALDFYRPMIYSLQRDRIQAYRLIGDTYQVNKEFKEAKRVYEEVLGLFKLDEIVANKDLDLLYELAVINGSLADLEVDNLESQKNHYVNAHCAYHELLTIQPKRAIFECLCNIIILRAKNQFQRKEYKESMELYVLLIHTLYKNLFYSESIIEAFTSLFFQRVDEIKFSAADGYALVRENYTNLLNGFRGGMLQAPVKESGFFYRLLLENCGRLLELTHSFSDCVSLMNFYLDLDQFYQKLDHSSESSLIIYKIILDSILSLIDHYDELQEYNFVDFYHVINRFARVYLHPSVQKYQAKARGLVIDRLKKSIEEQRDFSLVGVLAQAYADQEMHKESLALCQTIPDHIHQEYTQQLMQAYLDISKKTSLFFVHYLNKIFYLKNRFFPEQDVLPHMDAILSLAIHFRKADENLWISECEQILEPWYNVNHFEEYPARFLILEIALFLTEVYLKKGDEEMAAESWTLTQEIIASGWDPMSCSSVLQRAGQASSNDSFKKNCYLNAIELLEQLSQHAITKQLAFLYGEFAELNKDKDSVSKVLHYYQMSLRQATGVGKISVDMIQRLAQCILTQIQLCDTLDEPTLQQIEELHLRIIDEYEEKFRLSNLYLLVGESLDQVVKSVVEIGLKLNEIDRFYNHEQAIRCYKRMLAFLERVNATLKNVDTLIAAILIECELAKLENRSLKEEALESCFKKLQKIYKEITVKSKREELEIKIESLYSRKELKPFCGGLDISFPKFADDLSEKSCTFFRKSSFEGREGSSIRARSCPPSFGHSTS